MKKVILALSLIFCSAASILQAQDMTVGLKAGTTLASPNIIVTERGSFLSSPYQKIRPGFYGGLFFNYATFSDKLFIQSELLFMSSGSAFDATADSKEGSIRMQQLQVPLMVQYKVLPRLKLNLGVYAGGILGVQETVEGVRNQFAIFDYVDLDYGLLGGIEYVQSDKWSFNVRGQLGLKNLILMHPSFTGPNVDYQTQTISLGVNYSLTNNRRNRY